LERVLSDEEKFRKAEEIYNRRRSINVTVPTSNLNRNISANTAKRDLKRFRKMLIQIGVSILIYFTIYIIQYSNQFFSSEVIKKVEAILAYDINFNEKFKQISEYWNNNNFFSGLFLIGPQEDENTTENNNNDTLLNNINENILTQNIVTEESSITDNASTENMITDNNSINENTISNESKTNMQLNADNVPTLGTGGGQSETTDITSDDEQMKKDAQSIKDNYQITLPLRGTVTSRYGDREIEPKFHTGIDVARNTGSEIISATNGTVILAEEQLSYGKVLKIKNNDLVVLYAHCDEILVNVGDKITMMQKIATVGSTGNSTGPHLHFEIIYCGRYVNPEYVLEFKE